MKHDYKDLADPILDSRTENTKRDTIIDAIQISLLAVFLASVLAQGI